MKHQFVEARLESAAAAERGATHSVVLADLYRAHHTSIMRLCRQYLRDDAEAEDAAQETFLAAHKSLLAGSVPVFPLAWLRTIARNTCWERSQRRLREPVAASEAVGDADARTDTFADAVTGEQRRELLEAIVELPPQQQQAFVLCEVAGHSYAEAASRLAVSESALESLLVRARRQLRRRLRPLAGALHGAWGLPFSLLNRLGDGVDGAGQGAATAAKVGALPATVKLAAATLGVAVIGGGSLVVRDVVHRPALPRHAARADAPTRLAWHMPTRRPSRTAASPPRAVSGTPAGAGAEPATRASAVGGDRRERERDRPGSLTTSDRPSGDEQAAPQDAVASGDQPRSVLPADESSSVSAPSDGGSSGGASTDGSSGDGQSVAGTTTTPASAPAAEGDGSSATTDPAPTTDQPAVAGSDGGDGSTPSG